MAKDEPFAYICPAKCGCMWRDNHDGTMSLFGKRSQSCEVCEPLSLDKLTPVYLSAAVENATMAEHRSHVDFENELYATLVDALAEGPIKEADMRRELLKAARWHRERVHELQKELNDIRGLFWV